MAETGQRLIVHGCYHKVMTQFFRRTLRDVGKFTGKKTLIGDQSNLSPDIGIFFQTHSVINLNELPPFKATHIIRDPRDMLVSGYFYHLVCTEKWCTRKDDTGTSYQERLRAEDRESGLLSELSASLAYNLKLISRWDFGHPDVLELRYEEVFQDRQQYWPRRIFSHYGFRGHELERCVKLMERHTYERSKARSKAGSGTSHCRVGAPGDWKNHFTPRLKRRFKARFGDLLVSLGYEKDHDW